MSKAFTLVELLAVLTILAVVLTIVFISVGPVISDSENSLSDIQKKNIEEAAKVYYLKEGNLNDTYSCVNVSTLISKGYIEGSDIKDPKTGETITGSVTISYSSNQYSYEYRGYSCP